MHVAAPRVSRSRARRQGGCLSHFDPRGTFALEVQVTAANLTNTSGGGVPATYMRFNVTDPQGLAVYPHCGERLRRLRAELRTCAPEIEAARRGNNISAISHDCQFASMVAWDGTDCALQAIVALEGTSDCPPVPAHMADVNASVVAGVLAFEVVPSTCPLRTEMLLIDNLGNLLGTSLIVAILGLVNHRFVRSLCCRRSPLRAGLSSRALGAAAVCLLLAGVLAGDGGGVGWYAAGSIVGASASLLGIAAVLDARRRRGLSTSSAVTDRLTRDAAWTPLHERPEIEAALQPTSDKLHIRSLDLLPSAKRDERGENAMPQPSVCASAVHTCWIGHGHRVASQSVPIYQGPLSTRSQRYLVIISAPSHCI